MKIRNIEITLATLLLIFIFYKQLAGIDGYIEGRFSDSAYGKEMFDAKGLHFNFWINYLFPALLKWLTMYLAFIWITCSLPDKFITGRNWRNAILSLIGGFVVIWLLFVSGDCIKMPFNDNILPEALYREFGVAGFISGIILLYEIVKQIALWQLKRDAVKKTGKTNTLTTDIIWFVLFWGIALLGVTLIAPYWGLGLFLALIPPCMFLTYLTCSYYLIPKYYYQPEKGGFWLYTALVTLAINIPFSGIYTISMSYGSIDFVFKFLFGWALQAACVVPLSIYLHKIRTKRAAELTNLKTELGTSNAGLQFLRSQINPHFLFNALNTLYGTALVENAERTGEGIQKLGDMMRFMLHENHLDKIALSREIDYLHNYIDLQNLRIALSPNIKIEVNIEDITGYYEIAPMLLIPFVENAYKHGISLKNTSWISVNLFKTGNTLNLDVRNSIHPEQENDPERYHSGTGLDNVKQRLELLYSQKHELVVRRNTQEFFVHLSITLSSIANN
ncbi:MAG: histidine kinase [Bacteroidota bacterium]